MAHPPSRTRHRPPPCPHIQWAPIHGLPQTAPHPNSVMPPVAKPETWGSSLAFPSLTHIQLVTMSSKICPLICLSDLSPHLHLPSFRPHHLPSERLQRLPGCFSCLQPHPHLLTPVLCTAARSMGLFHKPSHSTPVLVQVFTCFLSPRKPPERKLRT